MTSKSLTEVVPQSLYSKNMDYTGVNTMMFS